jgi:hypothetical protein
MLADERARKRGELLDATEKKLTSIQNRVRRAKKPLHGKDKIALAVGAVIDRYKMAKSRDVSSPVGFVLVQVSFIRIGAPASRCACESIIYHLATEFRCVRVVSSSPSWTP